MVYLIMQRYIIYSTLKSSSDLLPLKKKIARKYKWKLGLTQASLTSNWKNHLCWYNILPFYSKNSFSHFPSSPYLFIHIFPQASIPPQTSSRFKDQYKYNEKYILHTFVITYFQRFSTYKILVTVKNNWICLLYLQWKSLSWIPIHLQLISFSVRFMCLNHSDFKSNTQTAIELKFVPFVK